MQKQSDLFVELYLYYLHLYDLYMYYLYLYYLYLYAQDLHSAFALLAGG